MINQAFLFFRFLWPIFLGLLILSLIFAIKKSTGSFKCNISLAGLFTFEKVPIRPIYVKVVIILSTITLFIYPIFRDYSSIFPEHYRIQVYFDNEGIEKALSQFNKKELKDVNIETDWKKRKKEFIDNLNIEIEKRLKTQFRFEEERGVIISEGETTFKIRKIKKWGVQKYEIYDSKGKLLHKNIKPEKQSCYVFSEFEILDTDSKYIEVPISAIVTKFKLVIMPEYKQLFMMTADNKYHLLNLITLIKVKSLPFLDILKSIYLIRIPNGKNIPIGYTVYLPD